jgi:hypothetical protein
MSRLNRVVIAAVLVTGVMFTGGVVGANPQPAPRGVCTKVGHVVSAPVRLVCKQTVNNGLRWRKAPITTTTTTTTTTIAPSTTVAVVPTVSLAATILDSGTFPKAAVVTSTVAGTVYFIEGASPVNTVSDITSAQYYRWTSGVVTANTPTSIALNVDVLTNGYYRVFVANSQGVLSEPAFNKVTISNSRASDVAALSCAAGGTCAVGDTGPGGGVVFYVQASGGTFACGATLASTCKYLEAAPANWLTGTTGDPVRTWATDTDPDPVGTGNQATAVTGARGTAIGSGYKNSLAIVAQTGNVAATSAAVEARAYRGNSKTDWHLPSKDELNKLYLNQARVGGFSTATYWSSSEYDDSIAWLQGFYSGNPYSFSKDSTYYVRPVRAFGDTLACADGGTCAVGETGPGGGVVFYVQASGGTFDCGPTLASTCKYLEAAPANWLTGTTGDPVRTWATDTDPGPGMGNQAATVSGARGTAIGSGYKNSLAIVAQTGNVAATSAAVKARDYQGNSKTDWHLPSKDELNELYLNQARVGGFSTDSYWSSSEDDDEAAWFQYFDFGYQGYGTKINTIYVRPVRAF